LATLTEAKFYTAHLNSSSVEVLDQANLSTGLKDRLLTLFEKELLVLDQERFKKLIYRDWVVRYVGAAMS
jgi:hypothetical protein